MYVNDFHLRMMKSECPISLKMKKYLNLYYAIKKTSRQCFIHTKTPSLNATCSASPEGTGRRPIVHLSSQDAISWMCVPNCNEMWYRVSPSPLPASMKPRAPTSNGAVPPKHLCMPAKNWDPSCPRSIASVMVACCSKASTLFPVSWCVQPPEKVTLVSKKTNWSYWRTGLLALVWCFQACLLLCLCSLFQQAASTKELAGWSRWKPIKIV